jgi:1-acyl-sn-glycerol-3-phosphate acyltransferase
VDAERETAESASQPREASTAVPDAGAVPAADSKPTRKRRSPSRDTAAVGSTKSDTEADATPGHDRGGEVSDRANTPVVDLPRQKARPVKRAVSRSEASSATSEAPPEVAPSGGGAADVLEGAEAIGAAVVAAAKEYFGEVDWEHRLAEILAFARRRITGDYEVDEFGFDTEITERFLLTALRPLAEKWFRIEVHGIENIPAEGGALVVSNHSGTVPLDGLMTGLVIHDHADRHLRALGADLVFRLPFVGELARKGGATLASTEDAERMLSRGDLVGVWPEGFKGIGKPFSERYKLQRFGRGGFVSAALRTGVPIVPCSVVGAEEIYPLVGNIPSLARLLGVPYIPITPMFPWLGPLGMIPLPSKWHIEFGEPIRTDSYGDGAADDPMLVFNVTDQVRETIQQTLYSLLVKRRSVFS